MVSDPAFSLTETLDVLGYSGSESLMTAPTNETGPIQYQWGDLSARIGLDAAFFHDGVPMVGFTQVESVSSLVSLRKRLWNYGRLPVLIATTPDEIVAYNALDLSNERTSPSDGVLSKYRRGQSMDIILKAFSRQNIEAGVFSEIYYSEYRKATRVDGALLSNLSYLRHEIGGNSRAVRDAFDAVLGGCLTARYLEDRDVLSSERVHAMCGAQSLSGALEQGATATRALFIGLSEHFNGDVFGAIPAALSSLNDQNIASVGSLLLGDDLRTRQRALWPYDFSILPADLVSSIYEQLLEDSQKKDAAYYTPRFLVDLVLDEVLPWGEAGQSPRDVVDPACGSGAFITEAFRRLAYAESARRQSRLSYADLQELLTSKIFGIDVNPSAARVTVFGLYLALLELVDPPNVWEEVFLPRLLGRNIFAADTFSGHGLANRKFDLVIGNPPWASKLPISATKYLKNSRKPVADKQLAQAFLWWSLAKLKDGGKLGLVMPAKALLHNRSAQAYAFRRRFFSEASVSSVVDLSAVRRNVFATAIAPAAVVIASRREGIDGIDEEVGVGQEILHVSVHPRPLSAAIGRLAVTPEEVRGVSQKLAAARPDIWKPLLWGSFRDIDFLDALRHKYRSTAEVAEERGWVSNQGYQVGGGDENDASHMIGMDNVDGKALEPLYLAPSGLSAFSNAMLHRTRDPQLFAGPHMIVKRTLVKKNIAAVYMDEDAVFSNAMVGIAAPRSDEALLAVLTAATVSSVGRYWHFYTASSWGVERDFLELNELLSLPLPEVGLSEAENALRLIREIQKSRTPEAMRRVDALVYGLYGLTPEEQRHVEAGLAQGPDRFVEGTRATRPVSRTQEQSYEAELAGALRAFLPDLSVNVSSETNGSYRVAIVVLGWASGGVMAREDLYELPNRSDPMLIEAILNLSRPRPALTTGLIVQPSGFFVDQDSVYIVKSVDGDRWSRNAALDDAERILAALLNGTPSA